jgi:hypothetical protein
MALLGKHPRHASPVRITLTVNDDGYLTLTHDGTHPAVVSLQNRELVTTRTVPPGHTWMLPYRIREAELLSPATWTLADDPPDLDAQVVVHEQEATDG